MANKNKLNDVFESMNNFYLKVISSVKELLKDENFDYYTSLEELKNDITKVLEELNLQGYNLVVDEVQEIFNSGPYQRSNSYATRSYLVVNLLSNLDITHPKMAIYVLPLFHVEPHKNFSNYPYYNVTKSYINNGEFLEALRDGIDKLINGSGYR